MGRPRSAMSRPPARKPQTHAAARKASAETTAADAGVAAPSGEKDEPKVHAESNLPANHKPWIDLINPTPTDEKEAHAACGQRIPSKEDLSEVESSSRHYIENGAIYLSVPLLYLDGEKRPRMTPVGFILTPDRLVTVRFETLKAFDLVREGVKAHPPASPQDALTLLIEAIVDTEADMLEHLGEELEDLNHTIFVESQDHKRRAAAEMRTILRRLGRCTEKLGKLRHSLATLARVSAFAVDNARPKLKSDLAARMNAARDDMDSLAHFQEALTNKGQFLLDAALGFINIDQNDVIKVLTVVSVVGVPPTLVASIYGMNFKAMPELNWAYGYPYALGLIVLSTALPLIWFKLKKWF